MIYVKYRWNQKYLKFYNAENRDNLGIWVSKRHKNYLNRVKFNWDKVHPVILSIQDKIQESTEFFKPQIHFFNISSHFYHRTYYFRGCWLF